MRLLNATYEKLGKLNLPRHATVEGLPTDNGGLTRHGYVLDTYTSYKSPTGDAVGIGVLQKSADSAPVVMVHRRQKHGRSMPTVGVEELAVSDYPAAEAYFLATATLLSAAPQTWRAAHPSDDFR